MTTPRLFTLFDVLKLRHVHSDSTQLTVQSEQTQVEIQYISVTSCIPTEYNR